MKTYCGKNCCEVCDKIEVCGGCEKTCGKPFGGNCIAAETVKKDGEAAFIGLKKQLIDEINALNVKGLKVDDLNLLNGFFVNVEYTLFNGEKVKFLKDENIYLGNQIELTADKCYGVIADKKFILVCTYGCGGINAEIVLYKKR